VADTELVLESRVLDRARKLVALDRALIEIGEPGVLERGPEELASLEARLFGPAPEADPEGAPPAAATAGGTKGRAGKAPALTLVAGALEGPAAPDEETRKALRAQMRLIPGGRPAV
jgi:hypothetical protein